MNTIFMGNKRNTKLIAHRGLSGIECENTLPAFVAAANRSYFGIECDIRPTREGRYVICHDATTGRVCERDIPVGESDAKSLRSLRMRTGGQFTDSVRIPYLHEYLFVCARYEKVAVVELKDWLDGEHIANIVHICGQLYDLEKVIFISFCFENLIGVRKINPRQRVQFLCERFTDGLLQQLKKHGFDLDIGYGAITRELISDMHGQGIAVNCWTCDDRSVAERLIDWGVDYITTNILE